MSKIIKFVALAAFFVSATSSAQSKFEGAYGQVGIGYESVSPSFTNSGLAISGLGTYPISTSASGSSGFAGVIGLGYMKLVNKDFLMGFGVEYSPVAGQDGKFNYGAQGVAINGTYKKENSYNIFVSPAVTVGQDGMIYGKVGLGGASAKFTESIGTSTTINYVVYSVGLGYKQIIKGGLYGFGEFNYSMFGDKTNSYSGSVNGRNYSYSMTSSANVGNIIAGIGYKF